VRRLSKKEHGFVDYGVAVLETALSVALRPGTPGRILLRFSGANAALVGAVTDQPLGLVKLLPMRVHLALDAGFAAVFLGAAALLRGEPARVRVALSALGASGAAAAALTDPDR
jgi:hypothetical protein